MRATSYSFGHPQIFVYGSHGKKKENQTFVYKYICRYVQMSYNREKRDHVIFFWSFVSLG